MLVPMTKIGQWVHYEITRDSPYSSAELFENTLETEFIAGKLMPASETEMLIYIQHLFHHDDIVNEDI